MVSIGKESTEKSKIKFSALIKCNLYHTFMGMENIAIGMIGKILRLSS